MRVRASNNGVTFSDAADVKVTVTNYSVGASPSTASVPGGTSATYTVTLSSQGGAYTAPVSLACADLPARRVHVRAGHDDAWSEVRTIQADHLDRDQSRALPRSCRQSRLMQSRRVWRGMPWRRRESDVTALLVSWFAAGG